MESERELEMELEMEMVMKMEMEMEMDMDMEVEMEMELEMELELMELELKLELEWIFQKDLKQTFNTKFFIRTCLNDMNQTRKFIDVFVTFIRHLFVVIVVAVVVDDLISIA